jgi:hypothetical protein
MMVDIIAVTTADRTAVRVCMFPKQVARILRLRPMATTHAVNYTTAAVQIQTRGL